MKDKVRADLIKHGNNPQDVEKMIEAHFELAASLYSNVRQIAEFICTVY